MRVRGTALSLVLAVAVVGTAATAAAELCYNCGSGSRCDQCRAGSNSDSQEARKRCEARGCKITGYTTCSGAANLKYCSRDRRDGPAPAFDWIADAIRPTSRLTR